MEKSKSYNTVCIKNTSNTFKVSAIHGRFYKNGGGLLGFYTL
jgi:hypothetical protein